MDLEQKLKQVIRDVPDFPKQGIIFKDITPILHDINLRKEVVKEIASCFKDHQIDAVAGIEARGFFFGVGIADMLGVPFVPVRKAGKLPYHTIAESYELEYGRASIEMHTDSIEKGWRVLIHDDLLATGGTAAAAARLIKNLGAEVAGFTFLINLSFLPGFALLEKEFSHPPHVLINY
jgi:adenine phosphoribosyltransferase